nr:heat shock 70 kDa protein 15-like [Tanacetum cinerariifolium]
FINTNRHLFIPRVLNECSKAKNWLRDAHQVQDGLPKHAKPVLLSADIRKVCRLILSKPSLPYRSQMLGTSLSQKNVRCSDASMKGSVVYYDKV